MTALKEFRSIFVMVCVLMLVACGGAKAIGMAEAPVYPGATELKAGDNAIASTLANNEQQAKAMGVKIEQRGFGLPKDADWNKVKGFYTDKLKADGWAEGMGGGGLASGIANDVMQKALAQANANDMVQTAIFSKGTQTLTVLRVANPTNRDNVNLVLSLNTR